MELRCGLFIYVIQHVISVFSLYCDSALLFKNRHKTKAYRFFCFKRLDKVTPVWDRPLFPLFIINRPLGDGQNCEGCVLLPAILAQTSFVFQKNPTTIGR